MPDSHTITVLSLGFLLGARHALDADHIAAVATLACRRNDLRASASIGLYWALGHTAVLLLAGLAVVMLGISVPVSLARALEYAVAGMLIFLGGSLAVTIARDRWHIHAHDHDGARHLHWHTHRRDPGHDHQTLQQGDIASGRMPPGGQFVKAFVVGMIHGAAGSAVLVLVILSSVASLWGVLAYIVLFGVGTMLGMMLLGLAISVPVLLSARIGGRARMAVEVVASLASVGLGFVMLYRLGLPSSLF